MPRPVMTRATFRFFTAAVSRGTALGPTSAAEGPMNPTNRKAEPTHRTPAAIWKNRNTSMNVDVASKPFLLPIVGRPTLSRWARDGASAGEPSSRVRSLPASTPEVRLSGVARSGTVCGRRWGP
jgi:hypothetical protein